MHHDAPGPVRVLTSAVAGLTAAAVPVFLTAALQGRIAEDLGLSRSGVGLAVAGFFLSGAAWSVPGGRLVDRIGASAALRIGMVVSFVASLATAAFATRPWQLTLGLVAAGSVLALVDPSGARAFARRVPERTQGFAFGLKEASIPAASLLAGLVLPVLGAQFGWRPAFVGAAVLAGVTAVSIPAGLDRAVTTPAVASRTSAGVPGARTEPGTGPPPGAPAAPESQDRRPPAGAEGTPRSSGSIDAQRAAGARRRTSAIRNRVALAVTAHAGLLIVLSVAAGLADGVAAAVATFLVPTATDLELTAASAGLLLSAASIVSIAMRIGVGLLVDRRPGTELRGLAALSTFGALGVAGLALVASLSAPDGPLAAGGVLVTLGLVLAAVLAIGVGWGWTGLAFLAAVRLDPARPARGAGIVLAGLGSGGAAGPLAFGYLADAHGFVVTWSIGAVVMLAGAVLLIQLHRHLKDRFEPTPA